MIMNRKEYEELEFDDYSEDYDLDYTTQYKHGWRISIRKFNRGLDFFGTTVHNLTELCQCAHNQKCYHEPYAHQVMC